MGTILTPDHVGLPDTNMGGLRTQLISTHSDGTIAAVIKDGGIASPRLIKVYTSTDDGTTWTLRATVVAPVDLADIAIAQASNGNLHIVGKQSDDLAFRHIVVTWGTWALSAWTLVNPGGAFTSPSVIGEFDVDCSDGGALVIAFQVWNGATNFYNTVYHRTSAGTWTRVVFDDMWTVGGEVRRTAGETVSIVALNINGTTRQYILAAGILSSKFDGGIKHYGLRINESTGAVVDSNGASAGVMLDLHTTANGLSTSTNSSIKRVVRVFRTGTDEWTSMMMYYDSTSARWYEETYSSTLTPTGSAGEFLVWAKHTVPSAYTSLISGGFSFSVDAERGRIFRYSINFTGGGSISPRIVADVVTRAGRPNDYVINSVVYYASDETVPVISLSHGSRRNVNIARHAFLSQVWLTTSSSGPIFSSIEAVPNPGGNSAIVSLSPANGAEQQVANPILTALVDTNTQYSQSAYRVEFQFATDSGFTTNVITHLQSITQSRKVEGTNTSGVTVAFSEVLPSAYNLTKTVWYYRARLVDATGNRGLWTSLQTFTVGHPPTAKLTSPVGGGLYAWNAGARQFTWTFYDPSSTDYQTAIEIYIQDALTGNTAYGTGKMATPADMRSLTINFIPGDKDQPRMASIRAWDSDDTVGPWSTEYFTMTDPANATIESPTPGQVLPTGVPTFTFTPATGGGRTIKEYTVLVSQGPNVIWSKRVPSTGLVSGVQQTVKMDQGFLENNSNYSVQVLVTDSSGMTGASPVVSFSTAWIPPATPTGLDVVSNNYNTEDEGYVLISWDDLARDPDFTSWTLYRKDDLIDSNSGMVYEEGEWNTIFRDFSIGSLYAYKDFFAPSNYRVTYRVVQNVNRIGQDIDSLPAASAPIVPVSDGYWLIEPNSDNIDADAFKLSIVTGDEFTDEQEEVEFTVIGRGRVVNKGQVLGNRGTLDVQLRNTGGTSARQKRLRLVAMKKEVRQLYLRNPFGDIFKVNISDISISRIAGVGSDEFCDVQIPYAEVS